MTVKTGDKVGVHYTGWLENGQKFDSSLDSGETFKFQVGQGMVIKGFDEAVIGMEIGEKKKFDVSPEDGYGQKDDKHVFEVEKKMFPEGADIKPGIMFEMHSNEGHAIPVIVVEVKDDTVTLDANHPLSGQKLTFEIELIETGVEIPEYHHHGEGCCCDENEESETSSCCSSSKKGSCC
jgi:peptidylprolyl isomerase